MQDIIKKYFWIVSVLALLMCAFLAAKTVNHMISGKFLNDGDKPAKFERKTPTRVAAKTTTTRDKTGDPLAKRNMFCSACAPEEPIKETVTDPTDPNAVPLTSLPLTLVATNVSSKAKYSFATILNTDSQSQGAYWVENKIPGAGQVVTIAGKYVDFRNKQTKRLERISLLDSKTPTKRTTTAKKDTEPKPKPKSKKDEMAAMLDEGIKKTGDNQYEIDRGLVDKVLANPMSMARGARVVPSVKNGKANGFKLYAIRPSSAFAKIGLRNGDTIHAINGFELTTPDKALEVYTKVKESSNLSVTVTRRGKPVTLDYSIR